jgi:hypothetical protein
VLNATEELDLLENLINARLLYNPFITPLIERVGPVYRVPKIGLRSTQVAVEYRRRSASPWSFGAGLKYLDIKAVFTLPDTYIYPPTLPASYGVPPVPYVQQVTRRTEGLTLVASMIQADANLYYSFVDDGVFEPYLKFSVGLGRGWLGSAGPGRGPKIEELHAGLGVGARVYAAHGFYLFPELTWQHYYLRTGYSDPIDRTRILVNPRTGNLHLVRMSFGAGFAW